MFSERGREKKLTVAFHFQFANQAAWRCDDCRRQGLEQKRNGGFLQIEPVSRAPVWLRGAVVSQECPRSFISADSLSWLEAFHVWRLGGKQELSQYSAKAVEAFSVLESELLKERENGVR